MTSSSALLVGRIRRTTGGRRPDAGVGRRRGAGGPIGSAVVAVALILSACASADEPDVEAGPTPGPTVADARFDGTFAVESLVVGDVPVELDLRPIVSIETEFGALTVEPGCNIHYGSFTLADDGEASFSVTGGSKRSCPDLGDQDDVVLGAIAGVDGWSERGDSLVLTGDGVEVELTPTG